MTSLGVTFIKYIKMQVRWMPSGFGCVLFLLEKIVQ